MKKRVVVLTTAMAAAMIFGTTAMAEEGGLSGKFSLFHFGEKDGGGTSKAFWNAVEKFQAANPDVEIDFQFTDSDNYQEKLTALMAGDELPDV